MRQYRAYAFDLDGTLFRGNEPIPHAVETLAELRRRGALVRYVTNNSSQTRAFYVSKLTKMGFEAAPHEVYSSATGTASTLAEWGLKTAYVVGGPGLVETLRGSGVEVVNADASGAVGKDGATAEAVVVGICLAFTYDLLRGAMNQIRNGGRFVATNRDATYPLEGGQFMPGAGSLVAAVATCSGVESFTVGKPNPYLMELVCRELGLPAPEVLVVGDRLDTDIECGVRAGCDTHLVLTGVAQSAPEGQVWSEDLRALT